MTGAQLITLMSSGVYIWKRGEQCLYIGNSSNMLWRVARHNVIDRVQGVEEGDEIIFIPSDSAIADEEVLIAKHRPQYNPPRPPLGAPKEQRICPACQTRFMQKRSFQIWCSKRCRQGTYYAGDQ